MIEAELRESENAEETKTAIKIVETAALTEYHLYTCLSGVSSLPSTGAFTSCPRFMITYHFVFAPAVSMPTAHRSQTKEDSASESRCLRRYGVEVDFQGLGVHVDEGHRNEVSKQADETTSLGQSQCKYFYYRLVFDLNGECLCGGLVSCRQTPVSLVHLEAFQTAGVTD